MMQMAISRVLAVFTCVLLLGVLAPTLAVADQATYIYDDLGRLSQVIDGSGNVATVNVLTIRTSLTCASLVIDNSGILENSL
jgi:hypothetical protein